MRSWILLCLLLTGSIVAIGLGSGSAYAQEQAGATSAPASDACQGLGERLTDAERALADRGPGLQERLQAVGEAIKGLEGQGDSLPAAERAERKDALIAEQSALQGERKFLESATTAWQAALDACQSAARSGEELERFLAASTDGEVEFTTGDVTALEAQLGQVQSALGALKEPQDAADPRLTELAEELENAEGQAKSLLEAERSSLSAEAESVRHKRAAREAELALVEAKLAAARELVGESPADEPKPTATAPAADEADALNKQRLAEQLDAEARDRLAFVRSRLDEIEARLEGPSADGLDSTLLENDREYYKRLEEYEQRRLQQAEFQKRAAQQKEVLGQLRARIDDAKESLEEVDRTRSAMSPEQRQERAAEFEKHADQVRNEGNALDEAARAEEREIEPLQQLLPAIDALESASAERLEQADTFAEYERLSKQFRRMKRQYDVERQQIDLMVATRENIVFGQMRQATLTRHLADLYVQCAEVLVPPEPSFWERNRAIVSSIRIVAAAAAISYALKLALWLIRHLLAFLNTTLARARFSVKRIGTLLSFAGSIVKLFVWVFAVVMVLNEFGIEPAKSTGALGLIGLIMAGMFQQIVVDFVKGLDIIAGRHYNVGDFVEVDGKYGHVVDFNVKHTRIRTLSGQQFNIPNSRCVPSRRFPDGYVDNYVDITLRTPDHEARAREVIDAIGQDLNRRVEPVQGAPSVAQVFSGPQGRVILRYCLRVLPGCDWVAKEHFIPAVKDALTEADVDLAAEPSLFYINRIETFRKLFSRRLSEEEIIRDVADGGPESAI